MPNNTIADNLQRLVDAKNDIADAIVAKGGTVNEGDGLEEFSADIATIPSGGDSHFASNLVVVTEPGAVVTATRVSYVLKVYAPTNSTLNITDGYTVLTGTGAGESTAVTFMLPFSGTWTATAVDGSDTYMNQIEIDEVKEYEMRIGFLRIYGASWSGGSETVLTRTDDAAKFDNPDPYVNDGNHLGYSPFDDCFPWNEIRQVTIDGNELVEIPKFWYKITTGTGNAISFQIATEPADGFNVSPAHQDRGDGVGERDYVYVGRYHCATDYKSKTGVLPIDGIRRSTARTSIHNLGSDYWQFDFAMFWTIRMLYIVEFADWNSQKVIGYGCGNGSSVVTMGYTDSMPYHTGTMASSRTTYSASTQYRYIEGIWDNVYDWCDGIRFSSSTIYTYLNPSTYSDYSGGTNTGTRSTSSGCISAFGVPSATDYEWALYPSSVVSDSSYSTYVADGCDYNSSGAALCVGGFYYQSRSFGMFYLNGYYSSSYSYGNIGARLQYLPPNS